MYQHFTPCFLAHFKNQTTRRTGDKLRFSVQHKINRVFEYSNNNGKNFKQLSPYLAPLMGSKNALVSM